MLWILVILIFLVAGYISYYKTGNPFRFLEKTREEKQRSKYQKINYFLILFALFFATFISSLIGEPVSTIVNFLVFCFILAVFLSDYFHIKLK